ncbi:MAG: hypothetical protein Kow0029_16970 [Candidatus Rifleibacteriota bacterium]
MHKQEVDFNGSFDIKLELMPVLISAARMSKTYRIACLIFLLLSLIAFSIAFSYSWNFCLLTFFAISTGLLVTERLIGKPEELVLTDARVCLFSRFLVFFRKQIFAASLNEYQYVVGKRYYSFLLDGDKPVLVREVILKHRDNEKYDVVIARFIEKRYENTEKEWQDYWHKAVVILDKPPASQVDENLLPIDEAKIVLQNGDGNARLAGRKC